MFVAADEARALAKLLVVSMCFFCEEGRLREVQRQKEMSANASNSRGWCRGSAASPQEGGFDVAEQRADARMPQRSTATAAVTKAMESDLEAGRCPCASAAVAVPV